MLHLPSAFLSIIMVMIMARPLLSTQANRIDSTRELIEVEEIIGRVKYRNCSILGSRPSCKSEDVPRFLKNRDIYDPKHKVIIGWTPKAGSTNTMQMAFRQMGIHYQGYWIHDFRTQIYQPCMGVMPKACYYSEAEWYSFKIVRNPFNRLVSSYFHSMKFNWVTLKHIQALIPSVTSKASVSFRIFVEYIHQATKKNVALDGHILQQVTDWEYNYFKSHDNQSIYDKIVKVEDFERDIAVVNNATGLSYSMSNLTSAHHHRGLRDRGHAPSSVMLRSTGGGGGDVRRVVRAMKASSSSTDSSSSSSSSSNVIVTSAATATTATTTTTDSTRTATEQEYHGVPAESGGMFLGDLPWSQVVGNIPGTGRYGAFYDAALRTQVAQLFTRDLEVYGYTFPEQQ